MTARTRVVCFDLGGVVVRICRTFEEAVLASGVALRHDSRDRTDLTKARELMDSHQLGLLAGTDFHRAMSELFRGLYSPAEFARIHAAVTREEYAGIEATIRSLRARGLVTACLSNTNEDHWRILVTMPALQALEHRFASHLWGLAKPYPEIYRRFERELGFAGDEILFFDDLAENVEGARALGWDAVHIDHEGDTSAQIASALSARGFSRR